MRIIIIIVIRVVNPRKMKMGECGIGEVEYGLLTRGVWS